MFAMVFFRRRVLWGQTVRPAFWQPPPSPPTQNVAACGVSDCEMATDGSVARLQLDRCILSTSSLSLQWRNEVLGAQWSAPTPARGPKVERYALQ